LPGRPGKQTGKVSFGQTHKERARKATAVHSLAQTQQEQQQQLATKKTQAGMLKLQKTTPEEQSLGENDYLLNKKKEKVFFLLNMKFVFLNGVFYCFLSGPM
jgi:hypothetical protein